MTAFIVVPGPFGDETVWSNTDPDRPAQMLARYQLPHGPDGDAMWALVVSAVASTDRTPR